ncbi:hypothetical protein C8Q80DRAFT_1265932 [Daedaleopsis nitida]|nr:hypothetical protein C8Q80DRAFT_1265932 [Daedaleopsis nitida]
MIIEHPDVPGELKAPPVPAKIDDSRYNYHQLPPSDAPPPYTPLSNVPSTHPQTPASVFRPTIRQTVNHFELSSTHDTVSGTFFIDPLLPPIVTDTTRPNIRGPDKGWGESRENADVHASFRTRHGAILLDLEVVAQDPHAGPSRPEDKTPARVFVSSQHGKIHVDVHNVYPTRSLNLHVENVHGKTVIFLPPTFDGLLVFSTRHSNAVHFLPGFAARTRTLRASDRETVVRCFSPSPHRPMTQTAEDREDHCFVSTQHGKIIVGISGSDMFKE